MKMKDERRTTLKNTYNLWLYFFCTLASLNLMMIIVIKTTFFVVNRGEESHIKSHKY